jgi:hypothetical protein
MLEERNTLLEEVRQLRAAVHIYCELADRLQGDARPVPAEAQFPLRAA